MSIWKSFNDKTTLLQEQYGTESLFHTYLIQERAECEGAPVYRYSNAGRGDQAKIVEICNKHLGDPVSIRETQTDEMYVFTNPDTYLSLSIAKSKQKKRKTIEIEVTTLNKELFEVVKKYSAKLIEDSPPSNSVFALVSSQHGLSLTPLGEFKQKLMPHHYSEETTKGYDHVKACLSSKEPCGRLILLQGSPGTGKSFMIRSLVSSVNSMFVVVGSDMISDLTGPAILPVLLGAHDTGKPITFILEDADVALTHRTKGAMTQLSGLLNLGDGLLGEMLDIRIIATTNAGTLELDQAITRPGRMCQHIAFDQLNVEDAKKLYSSLVKKPTETIKSPKTLAEVYRMARQDGWVAPKGAKKTGQYL